MKVKTFEDLEIWKLSIEITLDIYRVSSNKKWRHDFSLCDQIRRAVISISSNIVEGFERNNNNEFIHYLKIAKGSAGEARNQLFIAAKLSYISETEYKELSEKLFLLSNKIGSLIAYLSAKRVNKEFLTR
jgi:four helix bundle protein